MKKLVRKSQRPNWLRTRLQVGRAGFVLGTERPGLASVNHFGLGWNIPFPITNVVLFDVPAVGVIGTPNEHRKVGVFRRCNEGTCLKNPNLKS